MSTPPTRSARTTADLERGLEPSRVGVKEPHWYAVIVESGCLLCGSHGSEQRVRMPGQPPKDPSKRYASFERDWACNDHFI